MTDWWKQAVVYQVYPRSFRDADGDGLGDIAGITEKVPYLAKLGVDAIWLSPFYPSALADGGYDVDDYRNVDPRLGTLDDFDALAAAAHAAGIKIMVDIVPNHSSNQHVWFKEALAAGRGSAARDRYIFRDGQGENGELPPNDWQSLFGGPAWERVEDGQWYLHLFTTEQPDFNWKNPEVHEEFKRTLRFWSDRGVDGFRIDVAHGLAKDLETVPLSEMGGHVGLGHTLPDGTDALWDRPEVHEIYREWRQVFNEYEPVRFAVGEAWCKPESQKLYASPDELGQVFNFEFAKANWAADEFRAAIKTGLAAAEGSGSTTTWVLSNHDVPRVTTRFGLPQVAGPRYHQLATDWLLRDGTSYPEDRELGTRRARAALLMECALPGSMYIYQGEELGLFEVANIPWDRLEDPQAFRTAGPASVKGRDGCRVPIPWVAADAPEPAEWDTTFGDGKTGSFGFSASRTGGEDAAGSEHIAGSDRVAPHLPQPLWFADYAADVEENDPNSMFSLYRSVLALRSELLAPVDPAAFKWLDTNPQVIAFERPTANGHTLTCVTNFGTEPIALPAGELLIASEPLVDGSLACDQTAWVLA